MDFGLYISVRYVGGVRVRTHKDYGHGHSELLLCDISADVDEGTGTSSVQAPTKWLLGHY
jgi:hypothetical protein